MEPRSFYPTSNHYDHYCTAPETGSLKDKVLALQWQFVKAKIHKLIDIKFHLLQHSSFNDLHFQCQKLIFFILRIGHFNVHYHQSIDITKPFYGYNNDRYLYRQLSFRIKKNQCHHSSHLDHSTTAISTLQLNKVLQLSLNTLRASMPTNVPPQAPSLRPNCFTKDLYEKNANPTAGMRTQHSEAQRNGLQRSACDEM